MSREFSRFDYHPKDFDTDLAPFVPRAVHVPKRGVPLNAYKRIKFLDGNGNAYYKGGDPSNGY